MDEARDNKVPESYTIQLRVEAPVPEPLPGRYRLKRVGGFLELDGAQLSVLDRRGNSAVYQAGELAYAGLLGQNGVILHGPDGGRICQVMAGEPLLSTLLQFLIDHQVPFQIEER